MIIVIILATFTVTLFYLTKAAGVVLASTYPFSRKFGFFDVNDTSSNEGWLGGKPQLFLLSLGQYVWTFCSESAELLARVPVTRMQAWAVGPCLHWDSPLYLWPAVTKCHPGFLL